MEPVDRPLKARPGPQKRFLESDAGEACMGGIVGGGKRLALDTPIPTPFGWTTMAAIQVGDQVFDADGKIARVTFVSEIEPNPNAWELRFDDGSALRCDAEHQWVTSTLHERAQLTMLSDAWRANRRAARSSRARSDVSPRRSAATTKRNRERVYSYKNAPDRRGSVKTTAEILRTFRAQGRINHAIENPLPIDLPEVPLPIDPYCLGAWLGDGSTTGGVIHGLDEEVFDAFKSAGYEVTRHKAQVTRGVRGLQRDLKIASVFANKHIPQRYLRASIEQRLALLQGLCDTDGHAEKVKGSIEFTTTRQVLRDGMMELLASLGIKASCGEGRATLYGRDISPKWRITFRTHLPCFRIARKLARQKREGFRGTHGRRYIVDAIRIPPEPMRCITVSSPSGTYLAGREMIVTHNTSALLIDALRYVHIPGYAALIFRRNYTELTKPDGLIERAAALFRCVGGEGRNGGREWHWPSGGRIDLAAMDHEDDRFAYDGAAAQYIAFDELQTFSEKMYRYMFTRRRQNMISREYDNGRGIPLRFRNSATPGGLFHDWVLDRYSPWIRANDPLWKGPRAADGACIWYVRDPRSQELVVCGPLTPGARARAFFATEMLTDLVGAEYLEGLDELDPITLQQRKFGNWLIRPGAGLFFDADSFIIVEAPPIRAKTRCRAWDLASTPKKPTDKSDRAATAGVKMSIDYGDDVYIEHVDRFWEEPKKVEARISDVADRDDDEHEEYVRVSLPLDPGQAARHQRESYAIALRGHDWHMTPEVGEKTNRIKPLSAHAARRKIRLVRGDWNEAFIRELIAFPYGLKDQADAASRAFAECLGAPALVLSKREDGRDRRRETARGFGGY